jgi:hypothetical protein
MVINFTLFNDRRFSMREENKSKKSETRQDDDDKIKGVSIRQIEDALAEAISNLTGEDYECWIKHIDLGSTGKVTINLVFNERDELF